MRQFQTLLSCVLMLLCVTPPALAQYQPSYATERWVEHIHIAKNWTERRRQALDLKVLTEKGIEQLGEQSLPFNPKHESLRVIEAYTVQPDGTIDRVSPNRIRTQDDAADTESGIYGENKVKLIIFPKVKVGSKTHYVAEWVRHTPEFPGQFAHAVAFSPFRIIGQAQFTITHAPTLPIRVLAVGLEPARSTTPQGDVKHEISHRQSEAATPERGALDPFDFAPRFFVTSFGSWSEVAKAYQVRARPQAEPDARIRALAHQIVEGASTDLERAHRLYRWITGNIRYLGVFSASGGYVPVSASQVLSDRYGDCKGHATLFEAMLRAVGIESTQVLINTESSYQLPELPVYGLFDHVITYIPSLKMYLDATSRFARFGSLPSGLEGKPVLLTASGEIARINPTLATDDSTRTQTRLRVLSDGRVMGQSHTLQLGFYEQRSRKLFFDRQNKSKSRVVQDILSLNRETGRGSLKHPDPSDLESPWELSSEFELDPVINVQGLSALQIPVGLSPGRFQTMANLKVETGNRYPKACGSSMHDEVIWIELPEKSRLIRLPTPQSHESAVLRYASSYEWDGSGVKVTRHFEANRPGMVCGPADDLDWEAFGRVIRQDLRQQIFFEVAN